MTVPCDSGHNSSMECHCELPPGSDNVSQGLPVNGTETQVVCCIPGPERIVVPVIFSVVILFGCIGNILVILVILKNRNRARNTTNVFILNLSVADLTFLLFCVPFHATIYTVQSWPFGDFMCRSVHFLQYSSMIASVLTLVAMSVDRFMAVSFPIHTKLARNVAPALSVCAIIWIISLAMASPWPIFYTVRIYTQYGPEPIHICADDWGHRRSDRPIYFLVLFFLGYAIPLVAIFLFSTMTVFNLWATKAPDRTNVSQATKNKRKATRLVIVLVAVFGISWLPFHVTWLWANYFPRSFLNTYTFYYLRVFSFVLSYTNSMVNPFIYAFFSQNFQRAFRKAIKCCEAKRRKRGEGGLNMSEYGRSSMNEDHVCLHSMSHLEETEVDHMIMEYNSSHRYHSARAKLPHVKSRFH